MSAHRPANPGQLVLLGRRDPSAPEDDRTHLDARTREVGLRGVEAARRAIEQARDPAPAQRRRGRALRYRRPPS